MSILYCSSESDCLTNVRRRVALQSLTVLRKFATAPIDDALLGALENLVLPILLFSSSIEFVCSYFSISPSKMLSVTQVRLLKGFFVFAD